MFWIRSIERRDEAKDVAEELSHLPAADGKEGSHGDGPLPLRQVRVEGLSDAEDLRRSDA